MASSGDPYCYPGTTVLRNRKNIRNADELAVFEAANVSLRIAWLQEDPVRGPFQLPRLLETHCRIFDGVYPWAGEIRKNTGMMKKQRTADRAVVYADSAFIEPAIEKLFQSLKNEGYLQDLPPEQFAIRAAWYYGEIDAIHPFREGNSRTLRQFFSDLARAAGYRIDWTAATPNDQARNHLFYARDLAVMRGDSSALARLIRDNLYPVSPEAP